MSEIDRTTHMNIENPMPATYLKHRVFDDLKYMREFNDSLLSYSRDCREMLTIS